MWVDKPHMHSKVKLSNVITCRYWFLSFIRQCLGIKHDTIFNVKGMADWKQRRSRSNFPCKEGRQSDRSDACKRDHLLQLLYYLPDLWSEGLGSSHTWTGTGVQIEISISSKTSIATQKCGLDVPFDSIYLSVNGNNNGTEIHDLGRIIDLKQCRKWTKMGRGTVVLFLFSLPRLHSLSTTSEEH